MSSPVQAVSRRRKAQATSEDDVFEMHQNGYLCDDFVVSDGEGHSIETTDDDDAFEPIREAGKPRQSTKSQLGPPITVDEKLSKLNPTHQMVLDDFMHHAKKECDKVSVELLRY